MRIDEILQSNQILLNLHDINYQKSLAILTSAVKIKKNIQWLRSPQLSQMLMARIENVRPLAQFIIDMEWEDPDPDLDKLQQLAKLFLLD